MIVDSQVHIWEADRPGRRWPTSGVAPDVHLDVPLSYENLLVQMNDAGVDRAILVPPSWEGDRNDYALSAAKAHPEKFAVMGRISLDDPASRQLIGQWKRQPGMLGIRLTFVWERDRTWLVDGTADWLWPLAEMVDIPIMIIAPYSMAELSRVAEEFPELRLIVDHMGLSQRCVRDGRLSEALARTLDLAKHPNVYVKLSGLPDYSSEKYPFSDMRDPIKRVVDSFGPRRTFWGTDLSRLLKACSYREAVSHFTEELEFLSNQDLEWIMGRGIIECLRWKV